MTKLVGARLDDATLEVIERTAREERLDRTAAMKELICYGRQKLLEKRAIEAYRDGRISADKAAEMMKTTVIEAMQIFASAGLRSEETLEEFREGLKSLQRLN